MTPPLSDRPPSAVSAPMADSADELDEIREAGRAIAAAWPPLTPEQRAQVVRLLRPTAARLREQASGARTNAELKESKSSDDHDHL